MATLIGLAFLVLVAIAFVVLAVRGFRVRPADDRFRRTDGGDPPPGAGTREPRRPLDPAPSPARRRPEEP